MLTLWKLLRDERQRANMCIEDVRLGRKTVCVEQKVSLTLASKRIIDESKHRRTLFIPPPPSGTLTLSILDPAVDGAGIVMTSNDHPLLLKLDDIGDAVTRAWFATHNPGGVVISIIEGTLLVE